MHRSKRPGKGAILVAGLVLALALGGTATAAKLITSADIRNGTIKTADMSSAAKRALKGQKGATGAQGAQGIQGAQGVAGPQGATGVAEIVSASADGTGFAVAHCPAGTRPLSGGGLDGGAGYIWWSEAVNDGGSLGWVVVGDTTDPMTAFVYCSAGVSKFTFRDGTSALRGTQGIEERVRALRARRAQR